MDYNIGRCFQKIPQHLELLNEIDSLSINSSKRAYNETNKTRKLSQS